MAVRFDEAGISTVLPRSVTATPGAAALTSDSDPIAVIRPVVVSMATAARPGGHRPS